MHYFLKNHGMNVKIHHSPKGNVDWVGPQFSENVALPFYIHGFILYEASELSIIIFIDKYL